MIRGRRAVRGTPTYRLPSIAALRIYVFTCHLHAGFCWMTTLFDPIRVGHIDCASRIVMAPLTRNRAGPGNVPTALMAKYYAQRASAGLIITEATQISPTGQGYLGTPGIYSVA